MTQLDANAVHEVPEIVRAVANFAGPATEFWQNYANVARKLVQAETVTVFWRQAAGDSDDWQQIQMEGLKRGYESRSMR